MERFFLRPLAASLFFRTIPGLLLACVFLWSSACCGSSAVSSAISEISEMSETHGHGADPSHHSAQKMCHGDDASESKDVACNCLHPQKNRVILAVDDMPMNASFASFTVYAYPLARNVALPMTTSSPQRDPRPPPELSGPPVFYASTVLLI